MSDVVTDEAAARRRQHAERLRGMLADVASDRSLVDELLAERRADQSAEQADESSSGRGR